MPELLTPTDVRRLLDEHGLAPRRAAGQNFVGDPNTVRKIVRDADLSPEDLVLEVGPGLGSLTLALAGAVDRVVAVEIDAGLARVLSDVVLAEVDNVEVVHADALATPLDELVPGERPIRVVANLPYNLATPLVMDLLGSERVSDMYVMVQREVGQRWAAGVGDPLYAAVSVKLALTATAEVGASVSRHVFHPVPNVDSVMVRITRRPDGLAPAARSRVAEVVDAAFAQRRKTLRNTLRSLAGREALDRAFAEAGIDGGARAEELSVEDFVRLAAALDAEERRRARTMPGASNAGWEPVDEG